MPRALIAVQKRWVKVPRKAPPRDPNLDHPAVKLYRNICHATPNHVQRAAIVAQVANLELYEAVLTRFMSEGRPAHRVDWTLERYNNEQSKVPPTRSQNTAPVVETTPEEEDWMRSRLRLK